MLGHHHWDWGRGEGKENFICKEPGIFVGHSGSATTTHFAAVV